MRPNPLGSDTCIYMHNMCAKLGDGAAFIMCMCIMCIQKKSLMHLYRDCFIPQKNPEEKKNTSMFKLSEARICFPIFAFSRMTCVPGHR